MLSLDDDGRSIARISGGRRKGKILCLVDTNKGNVFKQPDLDSCIELVRSDGKFEPVPNIVMRGDKVIPMREIIYVCGPSGAGKSTWCQTYIRSFNRLFPNKRVFVISRLSEDEKLDSEDIHRIVADESLVVTPIDIHSECEDGCMFVFDDCDTINDDKIREAVNKLMFDILETGRHRNIYCLITSHVINRGKRIENNKIFNEISRLVLFPGGGNRPQMLKVLQDHLGLDRKQSDELLHVDSRWICIGKNYPMYLLTDKFCRMLT